MPIENRPRLAGDDSHFRVSGPGFLGKVVTLVAGVLLLVAGFMLSLLVFAVVATVAIGILGYVWWKTRELRQRLRDHPPGGRVIEGEVVVDVTAEDEAKR